MLIVHINVKCRVVIVPSDILPYHMERLSKSTVQQSLIAGLEQVLESDLARQFIEMTTIASLTIQSALEQSQK